MTAQKNALISECRRQQENCEYTAVSLLEWHKVARIIKVVFVILPIILSALSFVRFSYFCPVIDDTVVSTLLTIAAGIFPAIYVALNLDMNVSGIKDVASQYFNLRDRFRQLSNITSFEDYEVFNEGFDQLMKVMESLRRNTPSIPQRYFKIAQNKIHSGDYVHDSDLKESDKRMNGPKITSL